MHHETHGPLGNPLLQVHPSSSSRTHGSIDSCYTALRTASCPTWAVFLSIGGPPLSGSNTGIPWRKRHSTFTRTRKQTPRRNRRILRPLVNIASPIIELTIVSHVTVPRGSVQSIMAHSDRRPELFAAALIPYTAAAIALILRNVARRKTRVVMVWEDYLSLVAFVSSQPLLRDRPLTFAQTIGTGFTFISLFSRMAASACQIVADLLQRHDGGLAFQ